MASSLFGGAQLPFAGNAVVDVLRQVRSMGAPRAAFEALVRQNPQFAAFARASEGKSVEQVAAEMGVDVGQLRSILG